MAVAVATRPQAPQAMNAHSQTAQDALLDALLTSCEKPANPPLKSFGRDLKPYFAATDSMPSAHIKETVAGHRKGSRNKPTPPPVAAAAAAAAASTKSTTQTARANAKPAHGTKKISTVQSKVPMSKNESNTTPAASVEKTIPRLNGRDMAALLSWAGPGFCVAPSPDKVPLPTSLLLD